MKKLLIGLMLINLSAAQAALITGDDDICIAHNVGEALLCGILTTTSLPTMLIGDEEVVLNSDEAAAIFLVEAESDAQTGPLLERLAKDLETDVATIREIGLALSKAGLNPIRQTIFSELQLQGHYAK